MEIKRISENLMEIPYGRSIRNGEKILPPHYQQYANEMKRLINLLLSLYNLDNDCILVSEMNQIQSLYDNEIRQAIIDKKTEFEAYVVKDGKLNPFTLKMGELTADEREIILKGCLINYNRK